MFFIYILLSKKDKNFYVGFTQDVEKRLLEHNSGKVRSTKNRTPFIIVHVEEYKTKEEAIKREKYLKGKGGIKFKKNLREKLAGVA